MDIQTYLKRLGYDKSVKPDVETLIGLHRAHMLAVPFENLDIHLGRPIQLTEAALWEKIILHRHGGFCYELNGLFAWLLKQIGFSVTYLNARVFNHEGKRGREFDHLTLLVEIPGENERWLADVGFGDSFIEPLRFEFSGEQAQGHSAFRLEKITDGFDLWRRNPEGNWERQYFFDLQARTFPDEYEASCLYHQTSPKSSFTRQQIISRATSNGRISLDGKFLTVTVNSKRRKRPVNHDGEYQDLLKAHFGVSI